MLGDVERVDGFRRAIEAVVRPGDVVVDLGAGTGILSQLAARAGARHVYAIESDAIGEAAEALVASSPYRHAITVIRGRIEDVELPERANVAIGELLGNYLLDEDIEGLLASARARLLEPGAREIPSAFELAAIPIELAEDFARRYRGDAIEGVELSRFASAFAHEPQFVGHLDIPGTAALAPRAGLWRAAIGAAPASGRATWTAARPGTLGALALVMTVELAPGIEIATRLGVRSNWHLPLLPVSGAPRLAEGDTITATVDVARDGIRSWHVSWPGGEVFHAPALQRRLLGLP